MCDSTGVNSRGIVSDERRTGRTAGRKTTRTEPESSAFVSRATGQSLDVWWRHQTYAPVRPESLGLDERASADSGEISVVVSVRQTA